ncbi:MAG TPA: hypothetical protein DCR93_38290 [Cytophagales bacterium]|nr:hypothetical protein [Cytophagales bacterium]HAP65088.1 hypothetical protein [Cytophagales bacterium]
MSRVILIFSYSLFQEAFRIPPQVSALEIPSVRPETSSKLWSQIAGGKPKYGGDATFTHGVIIAGAAD